MVNKKERQVLYFYGLIAFVVLTLIAAIIRPDYSFTEQLMSVLGHIESQHPLSYILFFISFQILGLVFLGINTDNNNSYGVIAGFCCLLIPFFPMDATQDGHALIVLLFLIFSALAAIRENWYWIPVFMSLWALMVIFSPHVPFFHAISQKIFIYATIFFHLVAIRKEIKS